MWSFLKAARLGKCNRSTRRDRAVTGRCFAFGNAFSVLTMVWLNLLPPLHTKLGRREIFGAPGGCATPPLRFGSM